MVLRSQEEHRPDRKSTATIFHVEARHLEIFGRLRKANGETREVVETSRVVNDGPPRMPKDRNVPEENRPEQITNGESDNNK